MREEVTGKKERKRGTDLPIYGFDFTVMVAVIQIPVVVADFLRQPIKS